MARFLIALTALAASAYAHSIRLAPVIQPANGQIIPGEYIVSLREPEVGVFQTDDYSTYVDGNALTL